MVTDAWQVFYTAASDEDNAVFLQVVSFSSDICNYLLAIGKAHPGNFSQSRVWFFRSFSFNLKTYSPFLRALLQGRRLFSAYFRSSASANQLINCRHRCLSPFLEILSGLNFLLDVHNDKQKL